MNDRVYRSDAGATVLRQWCRDRLSEWPVPHDRTELRVRDVETHVVSAGVGPRVVVLIPGTNFNAATCTPLATALARRCRVVVVDLPGQPGLSSPHRPDAADRPAWYGLWLSEVLDRIADGPVTLVGWSMGAAVAMACASEKVEKQVLVSPGGIMRLRTPPAVLAAATGWVVLRSDPASARLLRVMHAPGVTPREELVEWMTLVARHVRTTTDPGIGVVARHDVPRAAVVGDSDPFLPHRRLRVAVEDVLGIDMHVVAGSGHLLAEERPEEIAGFALA